MKNKISFLLILFYCFSYSQTLYYTTDGKNRISESKAKQMLSDTQIKMEKNLGKKMNASIIINSTETKKDSIISRISFGLSDKESDESGYAGQMSKFINKEFSLSGLKNLDGKNIKGQMLNGKPTMINFWFANCPPCIDEMPVLNKIQEKYKDKVNFVAITFENEKTVKNFLKKHSFYFTQIIDAKKFITLYAIEKYPMNIFLDKNGILKFVTGGISYVESGETKELKIGDGSEMIEILEKLKK